MDELSAQARLVQGVASPLAVSVPRASVEEALQDEGADLVLDLVRTNGQREERRITLALDREALEALLAQEGEQVLVALDAPTLASAFDEDVEAHGLREAGATVAILVTAAAGGAGIAGAAVDPGSGTQGSAVQASVETATQYGMPRPTASDYAASEGQLPRAMPSDYAVSEGQLPRAMPSDYAAADASEVTLRRDPGAVPSGPITTEAPAQAPVETGDGGVSLSAPNAGVTAALAGGAALTIAAAAFALRRRREPGPAI